MQIIQTGSALHTIMAVISIRHSSLPAFIGEKVRLFYAALFVLLWFEFHSHIILFLHFNCIHENKEKVEDEGANLLR